MLSGSVGLPFQTFMSSPEVSRDPMEPDVDFEERDDGKIKLFVGQIPKTWDEAELRPILEAFGPIEELTVLRDRTFAGNGRSRGGYEGGNGVRK